MENFLEFLGRMHPMLVHFPIALILTGGAIELLRGGKDKPSEAGVACLLLGSLSALVAVGAGWLHAEHVDVGAARMPGQRRIGAQLLPRRCSSICR